MRLPLHGQYRFIVREIARQIRSSTLLRGTLTTPPARHSARGSLSTRWTDPPRRSFSDRTSGGVGETETEILTKEKAEIIDDAENTSGYDVRDGIRHRGIMDQKDEVYDQDNLIESRDHAQDGKHGEIVSPPKSGKDSAGDRDNLYGQYRDGPNAEQHLERLEQERSDHTPFRVEDVLFPRHGTTRLKTANLASGACPPVMLTFDAFGTLYHPKGSMAHQYVQIAAKHGYILNERDVHASFKQAFTALSACNPNYGRDTPAFSHVAWWKQLIYDTVHPLLREQPQLPNANVTLHPTRAFRNDLYDHFATSAAYTLYPDVTPLLHKIGHGFHPSTWPPKRTLLGVISNSDPRVRSILRSFDIRIEPFMFPPRFAPVHSRDIPRFHSAHFAFTTLSYECGFEKPDHRIFSTAIRTAQQQLNKMAPVARLTRSSKDLLSTVATEFHHMHVGDSLEKDVVPALDCGWDAVLIDRSVPAESKGKEAEIGQHMLEDGRVVPVITSLAALPRLLTPERVSKLMEARIKKMIEADVDPTEGVSTSAGDGGIGQSPADIRDTTASTSLYAKDPQSKRGKKRRHSCR